MEYVVIIILLSVSIVQHLLLIKKDEHVSSFRSSLDIERNSKLELVDKLAAASSFDTMEIVEIMEEQQQVVTVDSDIWQAEMNYGKWSDFDDNSGRPMPKLRGFWYKAPGRIIGVKMPKGSMYDMHHHPWKETLIGISGLVTVEIERTDKSILKHRLSHGDVIEIPPNVPHAVMRAKEDSQLLCIWGIPDKTL